MTKTANELWDRYCRYHLTETETGFALDVSRVEFDDPDLARMTPPMQKAIAAMASLEAGAIANREEQRMVGHYWLRDAALAPTPEIGRAITQSIDSVKEFAAQVRDGRIRGADGPFEHLLHIGIGGSALGPQLLCDALGGASGGLRPHFVDNTDPDGLDRVLSQLDGALGRTLVVVVSKSGGTPEPRNAMLQVQAAFARAGVEIGPHFVAITTSGSTLDQLATEQGWVHRFPLWDWVGGRTSVTSAVGLLPAALVGIDVDQLMQGARAMDRCTRRADVLRNPAALMAMMWHKIGNGRGDRDLVVLPYKDRLLLLSRYLQQLVMESLGKRLDRSGAVVHQGLSVYGNKGSTDQHAFVQQLRDGTANFFVTFIQVLDTGDPAPIEVEPGITTGDYLHGFLQGTRRALYESGRESITITIDRLTPHRLGGLVALFERTVGLYAELIDINAYHQPGVEAGKQAASAVLELQRAVVEHLQKIKGAQTAEEIAAAINHLEQAEMVHALLLHLAANPSCGVAMDPGSPRDARFEATPVSV